MVGQSIFSLRSKLKLLIIGSAREYFLRCEFEMFDMILVKNKLILNFGSANVIVCP